jgi:hypothetical protein
MSISSLVFRVGADPRVTLSIAHFPSPQMVNGQGIANNCYYFPIRLNEETQARVSKKRTKNFIQSASNFDLIMKK